MQRHVFGIALIFCLTATMTARADRFTYIAEDGRRTEVEAKIYATGGGAIALELNDGSLDLIPEERVMKREPSRDPTPITPAEMLTRLEERFGKEKFRGVVSGSYVIGVVMMAPLPKASEKKVEGALKKSAAYMQSISRTFETFVKQAKLTTEAPKYPLVVLVFETDEIFEDFTAKETGNRGLSAGNIAGFYSQLTNGLYIRMSECYTFATPLHEAIHQQCFNRGVLPRLAPLPKWFVEGMATGFEGAGDQVKGDPLKLNQQYAKSIALSGRIPGDLDWDLVASVDKLFGADIFAGEAYFHAWSMHWLLVSKYRDKYAKYLQAMSELEPLTDIKPDDQRKAFIAAFGKSPNSFESEFLPAFLNAAKKENFKQSRDDLPGTISRQVNLAGVDISAESNGLQVGVKGTLRNISPLRDMTYYLVVMTESGSYTDWLIPNLKMNAVYQLKPSTLSKTINGAPGGPGRAFMVRVSAVPADSPEAAKWARGQLPSINIRRQQ